MEAEKKALIELVQLFPQLWDRKNYAYYDKLAVENAWATISIKLEISMEDCQQLWGSIRTRYLRERKRIKTTPSGSDGGVIRKWPYFDICSFLDSAIPTRKTLGNISKVRILETSTPEETHKNDISLQENSEEVVFVSSLSKDPLEDVNATSGHILLSSSLPSGSQSMPQKSFPPQHKSKKSGSQLESLVAACSSIGATLNTFLTPQEEDEDHHFALSIVKSLGKISNNKKKLLVKAKIYSLLAEAEDSE